MAFDISKILKQRPIGEADTALGELYVYPMTVRGQEELCSALGQEIEKIVPQEFMKELVRFICYPKKSAVGEENLKPENLILNKQDVDKLSKEELELIASTYLDGSDYLFREATTKTSPDSTGGTRVSVEKGDIKYPQQGDESKVEYLHRLCSLEERRHQEDVFKMTNKFKHFSDQLGKDIRQSLSMGEALRGTLGTVRPLAVQIPSYKSAMKDIGELARQKEEKQLRTLRDLAEKMDKLIEQSSLSTEFMIENNRVQAGIAEELKESGDKAAELSRKNIFLTKVVIFLTAASVFIPIVLFAVSRYDSTEQTKQTKDHVTNITSAIKSLQQPEESRNSTQNEQLKEILEELRLQRLKLSKKVDVLEKQVRDLEKQKNNGI